MAIGFNPQKTSVTYEDNTGIPAPNPVKKLGRNQGKNRSFKMEPMVSATASCSGLKPCKDSSEDFIDEPITI